MKCKERVFDGLWHMKQCARNEWKDGYCKQHHPDTVAERKRIAGERWTAKFQNSEYMQLRRTNEKLVKACEALRRYGQHDHNFDYCETSPHCASLDSQDPADCTCGLTKAMKEIGE